MLNKQLKFYLAGQIENRLLLEFMKTDLERKYDIKCTSSWIYRGICSLIEASHNDYSDLSSSDFVIATFPSGHGTSSEISYAIAKQIPVLYLIDNYLLGDITSTINHFNILPVGLLKSDLNLETVVYNKEIITPGFIVNSVSKLHNYINCFIKILG